MSAQRMNSHRRPGRGQHTGEKAINFWPSLKRLMGMMSSERWIFVLVALLGTISVAGIVIGPRLIGKATDVIFAGVIGARLPAQLTTDQMVEQLRAGGKDDFASMLDSMKDLVVPGSGINFSLLGHWLAIAIIVYLVAALLSYLQNYLLRIAVQRGIYRLRDQARDKLDRMPLSYFDRQPRGELLSRLTNDADNISQTLQQTLGQLLTALLTVIGVGIMMFSVSWILALVTLSTLPVAAIVSIFIARKAQSQFASMWKVTGDLSAQAEEAYTGHSLVKVFGRHREVSERLAQANENLYEVSRKAQAISGLIMPINMFIGNIGYVLIAVIGGLLVARGRIPLGDVTAFIQYSRMFTQPITQIASLANTLQSGVASAERVLEILDAEEMEADKRTDDASAITSGHVSFDSIAFSYDPTRPLIENLSLDVKPGQMVAIVGPTGAGKTTLVNLLERFYELDKGTIYVDGVDISTVPRAELRSHFGMVLQDTWLFGGTIADNIGYGKPGATREEIEQAARAAHVDRIVQHLPNGYDTWIDDEGTSLSQGEKQLITIARAFIGSPELLILDEATSSVDTRTEVLVQEAMNRLRSGRTSFVIAHRLSTIRDADVILVMNDGAIVEQGHHDELLARKEAYWDLYQAQFAA